MGIDGVGYEPKTAETQELSKEGLGARLDSLQRIYTKVMGEEWLIDPSEAIYRDITEGRLVEAKQQLDEVTNGLRIDIAEKRRTLDEAEQELESIK
jgi:hypothetical protein